MIDSMRIDGNIAQRAFSASSQLRALESSRRPRFQRHQSYVRAVDIYVLLWWC